MHIPNRIWIDLRFKKQTQNKFMSYTESNSVWYLSKKQNHAQCPICITFDSLTQERQTNSDMRSVEQQSAFTCRLVVPTAIAGECPLWRKVLQHRDMGRNNGVGRIWWCIAHTTSSPCLVCCRDAIYWCTVFPSVFVETNWRWNRRWTMLPREIIDCQQTIILLRSKVTSLTSTLYPFYKFLRR